MLQARGEGLVKSSAYESYESYAICLESWQNLTQLVCRDFTRPSFLACSGWGLARETSSQV